LLSILSGLSFEGALVGVELCARIGVDVGSGIVLVEETHDVLDTGSESGGGDPRFESSNTDDSGVLVDSTVPHLGLELDVRDSVGEAASEVVNDAVLLAFIGGASNTREHELKHAFNTTDILFPGETRIRLGGGLFLELCDLSFSSFTERHLDLFSFKN
jgi:hypothetical protein